MRRTTILNAGEVKRKTYKEAEAAFLKHCKLKNLRKATLQYYEEDLKFFFEHVDVMYIDEISQEVFDNFILSELEHGKKVSYLNTRIRGLRVFFKFCVEREYMQPLTLNPVLKQCVPCMCAPEDTCEEETGVPLRYSLGHKSNRVLPLLPPTYQRVLI